MTDFTEGNILFLSRYTRMGASSRCRFFQYIPYLERQGWACEVSPLFDDAYLRHCYTNGRATLPDLARALFRRLLVLCRLRNFDLIVLEKEVIPFSPAIFERLMHAAGIPFIVDYDDAIFHRYDCHRSRLVRGLLGNKMRTVMRCAQAVVAGNAYLAEYAMESGASRVEVIPTIVDLDRYEDVEKQNLTEFTIGWIGSPTTSRYLPDIASALAEVCGEGRGKVLLVGACGTDIPGVKVEHHDWSEENEVACLKLCDVGIMPLPDACWERGKCGFKLIQYMACGLPVVASPVGCNVEIVEHGVNGFLARDHRQWVDALCALRDSKRLRSAMGKQGRKKVEKHYSLQVTAPRLHDMFRAVVEEKGSQERPGENIDRQVVAGFGDEWRRFDQSALSEEEVRKIWEDYFHVFPWHVLPEGGGIGADIGCGSGRWAAFVAPRVVCLHVIDPSQEALNVARKNLRSFENVSYHLAGVERLPVEDASLDFAYSLGVLHHVPDTRAAVGAIARKLKPGAPFLIYLYYAFDNRPQWYRVLWQSTDIIRRFISQRSFSVRYALSQVLAIAMYWPIARMAKLLDRFGMLPSMWPLAYYRDRSLYVLRTDALDRFGTSLEQRFTREQIQNMLEAGGFRDIVFSEAPPYWCACGIKQ